MYAGADSEALARWLRHQYAPVERPYRFAARYYIVIGPKDAFTRATCRSDRQLVALRSTCRFQHVA